jgi:hypothetical protein
MTLARQQSVLSEPDGVRRRRSAVVRWRVGDRAARAAFSSNGSAAVLEFRVRETHAGAWRGEVVLDSGEGTARVLRDASPSVHWNHDAERGLVHVDAAGFLHATIDVGNGSPALIYARSALLKELGLRGGRYEPVGAELEAGADEGA